MVPRLIAGMLVLTMSACSWLRPHVEQPVVSVVGIELRGGNLLKQTFMVKFNVQNRNDRALPVRDLHFTLTVDGDEVADGVNDKSFVVPARGDVDFDMNINASLAVVVLKLASRHLAQAESPAGPALAYELSGVAHVDLPFLSSIPFRQNGFLPLGGRLTN